MWGAFLAYNVPDNAQLRLGVRVRSTGLLSQPIFPLSLALAVFFPGSSYPKPPHSTATVIFCFHDEKSHVWSHLGPSCCTGFVLGKMKNKVHGARWGFINWIFLSPKFYLQPLFHLNGCREKEG